MTLQFGTTLYLFEQDIQCALKKSMLKQVGSGGHNLSFIFWISFLQQQAQHGINKVDQGSLTRCFAMYSMSLKVFTLTGERNVRYIKLGSKEMESAASDLLLNNRTLEQFKSSWIHGVWNNCTSFTSLLGSHTNKRGFKSHYHGSVVRAPEPCEWFSSQFYETVINLWASPPAGSWESPSPSWHRRMGISWACQWGRVAQGEDVDGEQANSKHVHSLSSGK